MNKWNSINNDVPTKTATKIEPQLSDDVEMLKALRLINDGNEFERSISKHTIKQHIQALTNSLDRTKYQLEIAWEQITAQAKEIKQHSEDKIDLVMKNSELKDEIKRLKEENEECFSRTTLEMNKKIKKQAIKLNKIKEVWENEFDISQDGKPELSTKGCEEFKQIID
jgi:chromosome segregation ATPase